MIHRLTREAALLLIVDVQTRLLPEMWEAERVARNCAVLGRVARMWEMPVVVTEQNPTRIGGTVAPICEALGDFEPVAKIRFSALPDAQSQIEASGRRHVLLCGLESHICVLQTGLDLIAAGYTVWLVEDAISARQQPNRQLGVQRLRTAGAISTSTETAVFELMQSAEDADFKAILALIK